MDIKNKILEKIENLPMDSLKDLNTYIDHLSQNNAKQNEKKTSTEKQLKKLIHINEIKNADILRLSKNLQKEWDIIKQNQILTHHLINVISEIRNPQSETFMAKRIKSDSRTGGFFEDHFGLILNSFLRSKVFLWCENDRFQKVETTINHPIPVPGERRKKQPDILIRDYKTKKPICIVELKAGFTKRSLIKEYNSKLVMWKKLNENINFLYLIFSCSSERKANTYKKVENCRVVCYDFKTDNDSQVKGIEPKIVDPIECVLDEIYNIIIIHFNN